VERGSLGYAASSYSWIRPPSRSRRRSRSSRNKVRLDAIQALLHESLGRPGQAETLPAPVLPASAEQVRKLSWDQMTLVFATQFAGEIAVVMDGDGEAVLRDRLAALGPDERRRLREALVEPELV
jgi:hypothetical protein